MCGGRSLILRNSEHPRGIDLGPARNSFDIGKGTRQQAKYRVAARLYSNPRQRRKEPEFIALIGAIASQAIADARAGRFATADIAEMVPAYRHVQGLSDSDPVDLEDVADWLRKDATDWLADLGVRVDVDERELADAKNSLLSFLQREPAIRKVA